MKNKMFLRKIMPLFLFICLVLNLNIISVSAKSLANKSQYTVLILDRSGSMDGTPLNEMKSAAKRFCETLLQSNSQNQIAIATYESSARTEIQFSNDLTSLKTAIDKIYTSGGTNLYDGLKVAENIFYRVAIPVSAIKNIVLFSDGLPNEGSSTTYGPYIRSDYEYYSYANAVYNYARDLRYNSYNIYTLGFFQDLSGKTLEFARRFMNDLQNAGYYDVPSAAYFGTKFVEVARNITNPVVYKASYTSSFNGHTYAVYDVSLTWSQAKNYCENLGGHLVTITSEQEEKFVESLISYGRKNYYHLGATDEVREGVWRWVTGEAFVYKNWAPGEPSNSNGNALSENFLQMYRIANLQNPNVIPYKWNDSRPKTDGVGMGAFSNISNSGFVCEFEY